MPKISLLALLCIAICFSANAQTVPHPAPSKKAVHKKTTVTKTVIISSDGGEDESYNPGDEEMEDDELQGEGSYVVVVDEDEDDNGFTEDEAANDDMDQTSTIVHKTIHHTSAGHKTAHIYSNKYSKNLYYYNAKTGYYYKRHTPLKS